MSETKSQSKRINVLLASMFLASGGTALFALRDNSRTSQQLYEALLEADESGENVGQALDELRGYIYAHMNTEIGSENGIHPPIQLQGTYSRLQAEEQARVQAINDTVYERAQETCEQRFGAGSLRDGRVQCVEDYVENNTVQANQIAPDLYRFDFEPPLWSPDLAGYAVLATVVFGATLIMRTIAYTVKRILS